MIETKYPVYHCRKIFELGKISNNLLIYQSTNYIYIYIYAYYMKVVDAHFLESVPKSPYGGKPNEKARPKDPPRRPKSKRGIKRGPKKEM